MPKKLACIVLASFFGVLLVSNAFSATMEEIESNYQAGIKYGSQGNLDLAIESFQKVLSADPSTLQEGYYKQTYGDTYLNLGIIYSKKSEFAKAIDSLNKALVLVPNNGKTLYYLAAVYSQIGEIAQAKLYFEKFQSLGSVNVQKDDFLNQILANYQDRESLIAYNYFFDPNRNVKVIVRGDSAADRQLMLDTLTAIEKISSFKDLDSVAVSANVIRKNRQGTLIIEKWTVGPADNRKDFWIKYNMNPPPDFPYKIMVTASEEEMTLDEKY